MQGIAERLMTPERYAMYKEMEELCSELSHPPPFSIGFLDVAAIDPVTRKIDEDNHVEQEHHSFLKNYHNMYTSVMCAINATGSATFADSHINYKTVGGTIIGSTSLPVNPYATAFPGAEDWVIPNTYGDDTRGIVTGRGVTGWTVLDFTMDIPIIHGNGLNELLHYDSFNPSQVWDGGPRQWTTVLTRYLVNRSGNAISITETGIKGGIRNAECLVARDVLGAPVVINNDKACKITYTFVSAVWPS